MPLYELIQRGWQGTEATLRRMTELAAKDARDWFFIKQVSRIVRACPPRDQLCELDHLLRFIKGFVRYQPDPLTALHGYVELVQAPLQTMVRRAGDCDDMSAWIAAAALALGLRPKFIVIKANESEPDEYSHVYAAVQVKGRWYGMDATVPTSTVGWEPPRHLGRGEWRI